MTYDQEGELIDEGILIWYPEGQSYTGEHLIEISPYEGIVEQLKVTVKKT